MSGSLKPIILQTPAAEAHVYAQGAQVAHFQPRGQKPLLFLSARSWFEPGQPIRGGVPICFPWFGPGRGATPQTPGHGVARLQEWTAERLTAHSIAFRLELAPWAARFQVDVSAGLTMTLDVRNASAAPATYEEALHTYLAVGDIRQVSVAGLAGAEYLDNTVGLAHKRQGPEPIRFTGETDRVYVNTRATCTVDDPAWQRRLIIEKTGSDTTVVWNPWIAKAKAMPDFGDDEWPAMLCIETANAKENAVTLAPGATHTLQAVIRQDVL